LLPLSHLTSTDAGAQRKEEKKLTIFSFKKGFCMDDSLEKG
jgi:hypothetical protein